MATNTGILATATPAKQSTSIDDWYTSYMNSAPGEMQTYDAAQAGAATWNVDKNQTVQSQIGGIIKADSPLMQMARTQSLQGQAAKGLGNSSLAIGAGQTAVYGAAMPIASQDASTYANAAKTNAELGTQVNISNAGFKNEASKFNAGAFNTASMQQRDLISQGRMQKAGFDNNLAMQANDIAAQKYMQLTGITADATKQDKEIAAQKFLQQAGITADMDKQQQEIAAQKYLQQTGIAADMTKQQQDIAAQKMLQQASITADWNKQQSFQNYDSALKTAMQAADQAGRVELQNLDSATRLQLADIEAKYKNAMQTSSSMANTYQSMVDSISRVMVNPDMDGPSKQAAINSLTQLYNNSLKGQEAISGLKLGELLDPSVFGSSGTTATPTTPTTPTAPQQATPTPAPNYQGGYGDQREELTGGA